MFLRTRNRCSKTCVKRPLSKRQKIGFQDQLLINAGQKYCRMLREHSHGGNTNFAGDRDSVKLLSTEEQGLRPVGTAVDR